MINTPKADTVSIRTQRIILQAQLVLIYKALDGTGARMRALGGNPHIADQLDNMTAQLELNIEADAQDYDAKYS